MEALISFFCCYEKEIVHMNTWITDWGVSSWLVVDLIVDYRHAEKVWKDYKLKNLGEYHVLCVQSNTLLFSDVFENFRDKCTEIYDLNFVH